MARYRRKSPKHLGSKMREIRLRLELTQEEVAAEIGTDSGAISRFERGLREPSLIELLAFSRTSGVAMEIFVDDKVRLARKAKY
jgi:transcriptional regulator with XRE-family HTH domain